MAQLRAFEVAIDLAVRQRDAARKTLLLLRHQCRAARMQLEQLTGYAHETRQRWGPREDARLQPEVLRHQVQFLHRLEQTIAMQRQVVAEQEDRVALGTKAFAAAEARVTSLRNVLERRRLELLRQQQRREQKETDELAMQRHSRGRGRQLTQGL